MTSESPTSLFAAAWRKATVMADEEWLMVHAAVLKKLDSLLRIEAATVVDRRRYPA